MAESEFYYTIKREDGIDICSGLRANFSIFLSVCGQPAISKFIIRGASRSVFNDLNEMMYSISLGVAFLSPIIPSTMNGNVFKVEFEEGQAETHTTIYFEQSEYRKVKQAIISQSWENVPMSTILSGICNEVGVPATCKFSSAIQVKSEQFVVTPAIDCINRICEKYGLAYRIGNNVITFYDSVTSLVLQAQPAIIHDFFDCTCIKQYNPETGNVETAAWAKISFSPMVFPGSAWDLTAMDMPGTFIAHTVIHEIVGGEQYTRVLFVPSTTTIKMLKQYTTPTTNDFVSKAVTIARSEVMQRQQILIGVVSTYNPEMYTADVTVGQDLSANPGGLLSVDITPEKVTVQGKSIVVRIACDGKGEIIPCYEGERVVLARLDDNDYIIIGKIYDSGKGKPEHGEGDYVLDLPSGGNVKIDAEEIDLGSGANNGVARLDDTVDVDTGLMTWLNSHVHGPPGSPPVTPFTGSITGKINSASSKVKAE